MRDEGPHILLRRRRIHQHGVLAVHGQAVVAAEGGVAGQRPRARHGPSHAAARKAPIALARSVARCDDARGLSHGEHRVQAGGPVAMAGEVQMARGVVAGGERQGQVEALLGQQSTRVAPAIRSA